MRTHAVDLLGREGPRSSWPAVSGGWAIPGSTHVLVRLWDSARLGVAAGTGGEKSSALGSQCQDIW
eukprot:2305986-Pyramimonas_sp.AAC.1